MVKHKTFVDNQVNVKKQIKVGAERGAGLGTGMAGVMAHKTQHGCVAVSCEGAEQPGFGHIDGTIK